MYNNFTVYNSIYSIDISHRGEISGIVSTSRFEISVSIELFNELDLNSEFVYRLQLNVENISDKIGGVFLKKFDPNLKSTKLYSLKFSGNTTDANIIRLEELACKLVRCVDLTLSSYNS
jgi:hypothetical protein